jgi:hypothetical protein
MVKARPDQSRSELPAPSDDMRALRITSLRRVPSATVLPHCNNATTSRLHEILANYCGANLAAYVASTEGVLIS